jgi:DNA-binding transcriptional MerR regulator
VPFRGHRQKATVDLAARRDDDEPGATGGAPAARRELLREEEVRAIEEQHATGLTATQIVKVFLDRGIKLSEASFRKYVQQGLLPRSRRIGRKGKHKGSMGVYPAKTIRRINRVKQLMAEGLTIEEIQGQVLAYTDLIENVSEGLAQMWARLDLDLTRATAKSRRDLDKDLGDLRRDSDRLVERLDEFARRVAAPATETLRLAGAAGSAEDLF